MQKISISLTVALVIVSAVVGIGIGYWYTPQYLMSMFDKNMMGLGEPDKWVDLRYLNGMIAQHREAVRLAEQAGIRKNEAIAIAELYHWKKEWYGDSKPVQEPQTAHLGSYNKTFDLRFLNALIAHDENDIRMSREIRLKSSRNEVLDSADKVELERHEELGMLMEWRKEWYGSSGINTHL